MTQQRSKDPPYQIYRLITLRCALFSITTHSRLKPLSSWFLSNIYPTHKGFSHIIVIEMVQKMGVTRRLLSRSSIIPSRPRGRGGKGERASYWAPRVSSLFVGFHSSSTQGFDALTRSWIGRNAQNLNLEKKAYINRFFRTMYVSAREINSSPSRNENNSGTRYGRIFLRKGVVTIRILSFTSDGSQWVEMGGI